MKQVHIRSWLILGTAALTGLALSASSGYQLLIGGKLTGNTVTIGGQTYVPLSALKALGVSASTTGHVMTLALRSGALGSGNTPVVGGANALAAQSGCLNQSLADGVWQVRFSNLHFVVGDPKNYNAPYWAVDVKVSNLTKETGDSYFYGLSPSALSWVGADGNTWQSVGSVDGKNVSDLSFFKFLPGQSYSGQLSVQPKQGASQDRPPVKLVWPVDTQHNMAKVPWSSSDPSFRVDLTCSK